ncbi:MAG: hypothetical protein WD627_04000 [Actinomycetota bacterium]
MAPTPGNGRRSFSTQAAGTGTGFFNSRGICSLGQEDLVYKLTFAEPGGYQLRCLFHPFMQATIKVVL